MSTKKEQLEDAHAKAVARGEVIPSLMDVLSEAVCRAKVHPVALRPFTHGLGRGGNYLSEKQLKRYLEERTPPPGDKVDAWVNVVAQATGERNRIAFWAEAVKRAKDHDSGEVGGEKPQLPTS